MQRDATSVSEREQHRRMSKISTVNTEGEHTRDDAGTYQETLLVRQRDGEKSSGHSHTAAPRRMQTQEDTPTPPGVQAAPEQT